MGGYDFMHAQPLNQSFESIYRRTYSTIYRFAKRLCRSSEDAEDVTQEAFARAYNAIGSFKHDRPIENWLIRIAHNTFLDLKRKERRRPQTIRESALTDDRGLDTVVDPEPTVDKFLERTELSPSVREALDQLDPESRQLIYLAHIEQMPYAEIAAHLGLKLATVRSRLHRACRRVRQNALINEQKNEARLRLAMA
jgi:RNA polymerase sigma-70 factor (ECF subfamily)